jgi:malate synthase
MQQMVDRHGLRIAEPLARFLEEEALPGTGLEADAFWRGAAGIFERLTPENRRLLAIRDELQASIDAAPDRSGDAAFLREIGYLAEEPGPFTIDPENVDDEVARIAGPQLVVPVLNARFLLNAANARWGSLYDALYGTDALPGKGGVY